MGHLRRKNRVVLLVVLSLMTAANTSYGLVLCFGPGGHVAIEPAGHNHCCPSMDTHDSSPCPTDPSGAPEDDHNHCCPCTDIPISAGTSNHQIIASTAKTDLFNLLALPISAAPTPDDCLQISVSASVDSLTSFDVSLRSVVLQV